MGWALLKIYSVQVQEVKTSHIYIRKREEIVEKIVLIIIGRLAVNSIYRLVFGARDKKPL